MILQKLTLRSFRAHRDTTAAFAPGVNAVCGPNGAGKTNLLEAVHFACLSRSFLTPTDSYALRQGDPFFDVTARFRSVAGQESSVRVAFVPGEGKQIAVNGSRLERLADLVGRFPVVVLSPGDHAITGGGPDERRRLVDNILSQAHPVYFADLLAYRRALKQRNALLRTLAGAPRPGPDSALESWTEKCARLGCRLITRRNRFVREFSTYLDDAYRTIEAVAERPSIRYRTLVDGDARTDDAKAYAQYRVRFDEASSREMEQGRTLVGPHRDEYLFYLDDLEVRRFASQGQHRTFGLALKLAQYFYIQASKDEPPIFLLDDVLDNLDASRRSAILSLLQSQTVGQTIITAADVHFFTPDLDFTSGTNRLIRVHDGQVVVPVS